MFNTQTTLATVDGKVACELFTSATKFAVMQSETTDQ